MTNSRSRSADAALGWVSHYLMLMRWSDRAQVALAKDDADGLDFSLAFFLWCYSLRDWLKHESDINGDDLESFIQSQKYWGHCRDIALRAKHYQISSPSLDADYGISRSFDPFSKVTGTKEVTWHLWIDGQKLELTSIIRALSDGWKTFIESRFSHPAWDK